ncbi:MAG TPA: right-handed parallel beta-helix repeat-containing protein [Sphingomicrobium sp.]|nr:right-handed parallel beta-helix repeat-containing protein [Sphingomicrobium sp.]
MFKSILTAGSIIAFASAVHAQATRTWVSGVGDDANPCSRTAPCKTFAGAISKTATGGEINAIDPGGFGAVTITKSITIDGSSTQAGILALNTNGIIVNGPAVTVNLRNLSIDGANGTVGNGIRILQAGAVNIDNVNIMNFAGTGTNGRGVTIETVTSGVRVNISNSSIFNMENHGIHAVPTGGSVQLVVDNSRIENGGAAGIDLRENTAATISRSALINHRNQAAVRLELTSASATISESVLANNAAGVTNVAAGGAPSVFLYGNTITRNTVAGLQINSGTITSLGNNIIRGNGGNEVPSSTITTQ